MASKTGKGTKTTSTRLEECPDLEGIETYKNWK